jgi:hypothetical protein
MANTTGQKFGGRQKGTPNKSRTATSEFFQRILTDTNEEKLWTYFMGHEDAEIRFKAFRLAIEYKRGKPLQYDPTATDDLGISFGAMTNGEENTEPRSTDKPN